MEMESRPSKVTPSEVNRLLRCCKSFLFANFKQNNNRELLLVSTGNFAMTYVDLSYNQLVVFEEGVFKEMLQQMVSAQSPKGYVSLYESIFFNTFIPINISLTFSYKFRSVFRLWLRHRLAHSG